VNVFNVSSHVPKLFAAVRTTGDAAGTRTSGRSATAEVRRLQIFGRFSLPSGMVVVVIVVKVFVVDVEVVRV
jgi:hypothetical protein